jgi:Dolichyl-phosphate-mannose-protein mannosyltransferase
MALTVQGWPRVLSSAAPAETATGRMGPSRDLTTLAVGLVAAVLSIASTYYYFRRHLILGYQDSFSHLEISRRVVAGLSPGIAQLGGIWLPVPQLLQDLFSWNDVLYRTGLAGSAVSMVCYVASTVLLYRLIRIYSGERKWPAVAGAMVFATNVNVLYQQSTSMDELPFYAFTIAAVYYLVKWGETRNPTDVLASSIASMLAVLCRYEGWYLAAVYVICVMVMALRSGYSWRDTRGLALASAIFGLLIPTGGWLLYNFMIFNNPLNFENGPDSSAAQMAERHIDINIGSWPLTFNGYGYAVLSDLGLAVIMVAALGLVVFLATERFSARSVPVLGLLTIVPFFLWTLEAGKEPLSMPQQSALLNYRFGLVVVIPSAILIGYLTSRLPGPVVLPAALASILALAAMSGQSFGRHQVVLATEAAQDLWAQRAQIQAGTFLVQHTTGLILLDIVQNERVGFDVVDRTIYDGTREAGTNRWAAVLRNPQAYGIRVIVMRLPNPAEPVDVAYYALHDSPRLRSYRLIYHSQAYLIYGLSARIEPRRG